MSFRLCIDTSVCNELLRLGGLTRLLELCKEPMERNYSDAVLVACLAVVRRVRNNLKMDREGDTKLMAFGGYLLQVSKRYSFQ